MEMSFFGYFKWNARCMGRHTGRFSLWLKVFLLHGLIVSENDFFDQTKIGFSW